MALIAALTSNVLAAADKSLRIVTRADQSCNHIGGYLTIVSCKDGRVFVCVEVGCCPKSKAGKRMALSIRNAKALFKNPECKSSWEIRSIKKHISQGAVVADDLIVSFAGVSGPEDEAIALSISRISNWLYMKDARRIARASRNRIYLKMADPCQQH